MTAVVDPFNRNVTPVYSAAMDMSKAFDLVECYHPDQERSGAPLPQAHIVHLHPPEVQCNMGKQVFQQLLRF